MKKIFVYGILQKGISASNFGLVDKYYVGRAKLPGYYRQSLTSIYKGDEKDEVEGDIWNIPEEIEENLYRFEAQFGYNRGTTNPIRISDKREFETISYLLPQR